MLGKQVSQATFDAIVREAIDDFGLSEQEALDDAKEQLSKAGVVDFSNIITSLSTTQTDDHPAIQFVTSLKLAESNAEKTQLLNDFVSKASTTVETDELVGVAGAQSAVELSTSILNDVTNGFSDDFDSDAVALTCAACNTITTLCGKNELNRMRFVKAIPDAVVTLKITLRYVERGLRSAACDNYVQLTYALLRTIRSVQRCNENMKRRIACGSSLDDLLSILDACAHTVANVRATRVGCSVFRQLLTSDDNTELVSETFNRARVLSGESTATQSGLRPLEKGRTLPLVLLDILKAEPTDDTAVTAEALGAARMCAVADEICKTMIEIGYIEEVARFMNDEQEIIVARAAVALLRNLAARDECKSKLAEFVPIVMGAMRKRKDVSVTEHSCGFLAGLCLRRPDLAKRFAEDGIFSVVVQVMSDFADVPTVLRSCCHALRNGASRDKEARALVRGINGVEARIREAMQKFPVLCDAAGYDALRDLDFLALSEMRRDERYKLPDNVMSTQSESR